MNSTLAAFVVAFFLVGIILVLALILDPLAKENDDRTRPGMPADHRNRHERPR